MSMDDVIQVKVPEHDSQYCLRACPVCQSDNVAYIQTASDGELWHGKCFDCGHIGQGAEIQHDAQISWNRGVGVHDRS